MEAQPAPQPEPPARNNYPVPPEEMQNVDPQVLQTAQALTNAEVSILLQNYVNAQKAGDPTWQVPPLVKKTQEYVEHHNRARNEEACHRVREMLMSFQQRDYEMALVANLTPEDAREAVSLIPSLDDPSRLTTDQLDDMLQNLATMRDYE